MVDWPALHCGSKREEMCPSTFRWIFPTTQKKHVDKKIVLEENWQENNASSDNHEGANRFATREQITMIQKKLLTQMLKYANLLTWVCDYLCFLRKTWDVILSDNRRTESSQTVTINFVCHHNFANYNAFRSNFIDCTFATLSLIQNAFVLVIFFAV